MMSFSNSSLLCADCQFDYSSSTVVLNNSKRQQQTPAIMGKDENKKMNEDLKHTVRLVNENNYKSWTPIQLGRYLSERGLHGYGGMFEYHQIDGSIAHDLSEEDLEEMGVDILTDRLKLIEVFGSLQRAHEQQDREKVLWEGKEELYDSCCHWCVKTWCGCCPVDPFFYTLQKSHLQLKRKKYNRCGPFECCFGYEYIIDNVDLSNVTDVDVAGVPPPLIIQCCCCFGHTLEHVIVGNKFDGEDKYLTLKKGEGQKVARRIKHQTQVMQMEERS